MPMTDAPQTRRAGRREGALTLAGLQTFVAVAEARGFGQAAQMLGVSQPSVSVQIATLEQALGMLLFTRRPRLELTEPGRELYLRARLVLGRMDELEAAMRDIRQLERGQLAFGFSTAHYAMPLLARFAAAHPSIRVNMTMGNTTQLLDQLTECRLDVGLMSLIKPLPGFVAVRVATPALCLCMPAGHRLAAAQCIEPAMLGDVPVVLREPGSVTRAVFESICESAGLQPNIAMEAASGVAVIEAVRAGFGLGPVFAGTVPNDPALSVRPFSDTPRGCGVFAVALRETLALPPVGAFMALLREDAGEGKPVREIGVAAPSDAHPP